MQERRGAPPRPRSFPYKNGGGGGPARRGGGGGGGVGGGWGGGGGGREARRGGGWVKNPPAGGGGGVTPACVSTNRAVKRRRGEEEKNLLSFLRGGNRIHRKDCHFVEHRDYPRGCRPDPDGAWIDGTCRGRAAPLLLTSYPAGSAKRFEWTEGRLPTSRGSQADVDRSRCASLIGSTIWGSKAAHWTLWR